jgi:transcriptional antiterminator RfaH
MCASWFVVETQPRAEGKAKRHLINQGVTTYLPLCRRRLRHARRIEIVLRLLFLGYLFVQFDAQRHRWLSINGTVGVKQILTDGHASRVLGDSVVDEILAREDETGAVRLSPPAIKPGQAVQLLDCPFADVSGLFEEARDHNRGT